MHVQIFSGDFLYLHAFLSTAVVPERGMCSRDSSSECSYNSEDCEIFLIRDYNMEVEDDFDDSAADSASNKSCNEMAYANEPKKYREEVKENEELDQMLQKRLDSTKQSIVDKFYNVGYVV